MKLHWIYFLSAVLLLPSVLPAQNRDEEMLDWSPNHRLTWADYKASPNPSSDAAASTTTYLSIEYNLSGNNFSYQISSKFSKSRSWGLYKTDYILSHEQGHFDIAEIFARILNKRMSEYTFNRRTYQRDLKRIYDEVTDAKEEMQEDYDRETNHSINKTKQQEWLVKIRNLLKEYEDYADY